MIKDRKLVGCIAYEEYYTISGKNTMLGASFQNQ